METEKTTPENIEEPTTSVSILESDSGIEEEFEPVRLTSRQWLYVSISILVSFIIFLGMLFPVTDVVRYIVYKNLKGIEFQDLKLSAMGKDIVSNLVIRDEGLDIRSKKIESKLGWFSLLRKRAKGSMTLYDSEIDNPALLLNAKKIDLNLNIGPLQKKSKKKLSGSIKIKLSQINIDRIGPLPLEPGLLKVSEANVNISIANGNFEFRKFEINSNAFFIEIKNGRLGSASKFTNSALNGKLCLSPTNQLRENEKFASLRSMYEMIGGDITGKLCTDLRGTLGKPDIKMPTFNPETESTATDGFTGEKYKKESIDKKPIVKPEMPEDLKNKE